MAPSPPDFDPPRHAVTVALEDYFHAGALRGVAPRERWYRFSSRLDRATDATLRLLDRHARKATFFALGCIADQRPELIRRIAAAGHEIASKGYFHRGLAEFTPETFRADAAEAKAALEAAAGTRVLGYRLSDGWFGPKDTWALAELAATGHAYDSSVAGLGRRFASEPEWLAPMLRQTPNGPIHELPIPSLNAGGWRVPIGGGNWLRQLPTAVLRPAARRWIQRYGGPFTLYFHVWELDLEQPRLNARSWLARQRHYRNLASMPEKLAWFFDHYDFGPAATVLGMPRLPAPPSAVMRVPPAPEIGPPPALPAARRVPVTVAVPCYNEETAAPYLGNTLRSLHAALGAAGYEPRFLLVEDGSADDTWQTLQRVFEDWPCVRLLRHGRNRGVAAAFATAFREADTEIVCTMDADCTYDPHDLVRMIPRVEAGADMVTASPYHPEGEVKNVPRWRLVLSRGASWLYRRTLPTPLCTYTSCFRVQRRSAVAGLAVEEQGFLGVAEYLARLDLAGGKIVEHPATLESRVLGHSKMKTLRTIFGHLRLLRRLRKARQAPRAPRPPAPARPAPSAEESSSPAHKPAGTP